MALPGLLLTVLAGPTVPLPLPEPVLSRLRSVKVTETDSERSAFSLTLDAGRSGPPAAFDNPLLTDSPLRPGARVVLVVTLGRGAHRALIDGIVTEPRAHPRRPAGQRDARRQPARTSPTCSTWRSATSSTPR